MTVLAPGIDAARLVPDAPWAEVARWCGGVLGSWRDEGGDWHDYIAVPQASGEPVKAWEWQWIVRYPDGTFAVFLDDHMPERALWPQLWRKLVGDHSWCVACGGDENVGCRDRHESESKARWATRVVVEHLGLKPEVLQC